MSIFKGVNGEYSSKRCMGILYMVTGLLLFVYKEIKESIIANPEVFIGIIVTGAGLLGVSVVEYMNWKKKEPSNPVINRGEEPISEEQNYGGR